MTKLISNLPVSGSFGQDRLNSESLKVVAKEISRPVQHIINTSLRTMKVAQKWKVSKVTPRLKSNDLNKFDVSSYRPVAVLSTISKLVDRTAQQQMLQFLEETQQMNSSNHAYRKAMSTTTTLTEILDILYQGVEDKKLSSLMVIDQSSAFDCVDHYTLVRKLRRYNIGTEVIMWIQHYQDNRS